MDFKTVPYCKNTVDVEADQSRPSRIALMRWTGSWTKQLGGDIEQHNKDGLNNGKKNTEFNPRTKSISN